MQADTATSRRPRSRITDGRTLLPGVGRAASQSAWARLFRDMNETMLTHVGGADYASEPQRLVARRIAALETELRFQEVKLAGIRNAGGEPDGGLLDLYSRISNTQRRLLEALGMQRVPRDVTPSLASYLADHAARADAAAHAHRVSAPPGVRAAPANDDRISAVPTGEAPA